MTASTGAIALGMLIMGTLVYKATDLIKYATVLLRTAGKKARRANQLARSEAWSGIIALAIGAVLGVGIVFLMDLTTWTNDISFLGVTLLSMSVLDKIALGLVLTSLASTLFDFKKAVDGTDTASTPKVLPAADDARRQRVAARMAKPAVSYQVKLDGELKTRLAELRDHEQRIEAELAELLEGQGP